MKHLFKALLLVVTLGFISNVAAHGSHQSINGQEAIMITSKTLKQMTFKDFGFEAGKLDTEWKDVAYDNINVLNIIEGHYIVKASLSEEDSVFLQIAPDGQVINVKTENSF